MTPIAEVDLEQAAALVLLALANLAWAETRIRRVRAAAAEARQRAWDAQQAAGATHRPGDRPPAA